ncbi:MAG TPA: hypothetical protein VI011_21440 [Asanoa sp.]
MDSALKAGRRMLDSFVGRSTPWLEILVHARFSELCLLTEQGAEAHRHLLISLAAMDRVGPWPDNIGLRWALALACLQMGEFDEAQRWTEAAERDTVDEQYDTASYAMALKAEIRLGRGDVDGGLELWRRVFDQRVAARDPLFRIEPAGLDPWMLEAQSVAVVAHARHGRTEAIAPLGDSLPARVAAMLEPPGTRRPPFLMDQPIVGSLLLALSMVDIARGANRSGARLVAMSERFRVLRGFQPTMSSTLARAAAREADGPAYDDDASSYAGLDRAGLRAAALAALAERP